MLLRQKRWTVKPPYATPFDKGDPINYGLYDAYFNGGLVLLDDSITNRLTSNSGTVGIGKFGRALALNGSQNASQSSSPTTPVNWGTSWSISWWMNVVDNTNTCYIFDHTNNRTIICGYQAGNVNVFNAGGYPTGTASGTQMPVSNGTWTHFIYTTDGSRIQGYKNGAQVLDVSANLNMAAYSRLFIGSTTSSAAFYNGSLDNIRFWTRHLKAYEAKRLYEEPFAGLFSKEPIAFKAGAGGNAYTLDASPASYTLTGVAATLLRDSNINAAAASYTLTGVAATLLRDSNINAAAASYTLTGVAATLEYTQAGAYTLDAQPGAFTLTGAAATLLADRLVVGSPASYSLTGAAATLERGYTLTASPGAFTLTGASVDTPLTRLLDASPGSYTFTGVAATLTASSAPGTEGVYPGAGHPVDWQGPRRKLRLKERPRAHLDAILNRVVADYLAAKAPPKVIKKAKAEARKALREFEVEERNDPVAEQVIEADWATITEEADEVRDIMKRARLARIRKDDDDLLTLLS